MIIVAEQILERTVDADVWIVSLKNGGSTPTRPHTRTPARLPTLPYRPG